MASLGSKASAVTECPVLPFSHCDVGLGYVSSDRGPASRSLRAGAVCISSEWFVCVQVGPVPFLAI